MDQPRKVAKPAHGQLNREIKYPCRCIRGKYICINIYIYLGYMYIRARFTAVYVLLTCLLHTDSWCGKERRILIGPW